MLIWGGWGSPMQHSRPGRCPSPSRCIRQGLSAFLGVLWSIGGIRLAALVLSGGGVLLVGREFGGEFGEFGGDAINDVGDGSAVRVDGVVLLWR